jgi:hypothetical protein
MYVEHEFIICRCLDVEAKKTESGARHLGSCGLLPLPFRLGRQIAQLPNLS